MRISDWSSDVCSSDLRQARIAVGKRRRLGGEAAPPLRHAVVAVLQSHLGAVVPLEHAIVALIEAPGTLDRRGRTANLLEDDVEGLRGAAEVGGARSEEHTAELKSLMSISYAVF